MKIILIIFFVNIQGERFATAEYYPDMATCQRVKLDMRFKDHVTSDCLRTFEINDH